MQRKKVPFGLDLVRRLEARTPTPFHVYDGAGIVARAEALNAAFSWSPGYRNHFAVKATPNPAILELLKPTGSGADCSSLAELVLAQRAGLRGEEIMFTSARWSASPMAPMTPGRSSYSKNTAFAVGAQ